MLASSCLANLCKFTLTVSTYNLLATQSVCLLQLPSSNDFLKYSICFINFKHHNIAYIIATIHCDLVLNMNSDYFKHMCTGQLSWQHWHIKNGRSPQNSWYKQVNLQGSDILPDTGVICANLLLLFHYPSQQPTSLWLKQNKMHNNSHQKTWYYCINWSTGNAHPNFPYFGNMVMSRLKITTFLNPLIKSLSLAWTLLNFWIYLPGQ